MDEAFSVKQDDRGHLVLLHRERNSQSARPLSPLPLARREDEGERSAVTCATLLCMILTLPLSLAKGEATRVRGAFWIYQSAN
jgi:hypothetical protein